MRVSHVPEIVENLRQTESAKTRSRAIISFCKGLRRGPLFQPCWDAIGGAVGLADLMAEFSLRDIKYICRRLGKTATAQNARPERHAGLAELVRILYADDSNPDPRPLSHYYQDIVPACSLEVVREWDEQRKVEWTKFQRLSISQSHRPWYEKRFLKVLFSAEGKTSFAAETRVFHGNLAFSESILKTLIADKDGESHIPSDFMRGFAMPLLQRLFRRRKQNDHRRDEARDKFLGLVVQCIQVHTIEFSDRYDEGEPLLRYSIQRWSSARNPKYPISVETREKTEQCLVQIIKLMPRKARQLERLQNIFNLLEGRDSRLYFDSYQLLRLILLHAKGYEIDIDDNTPSTLSRLQQITKEGNYWPTALFFHLDIVDAISLFKRLSDINLKGSFLSKSSRRQGRPTVLAQSLFLNSAGGDPEIVRCLLDLEFKKGPGDPEWLDRARSLVLERRQKAEEGREWQDRVFWAKSALNLSVAAGDLEFLEGTVLWARRFNNQPLVIKSLYDDSAFGTLEIRDLLSAVPLKDEDGKIRSGQDPAVVAAAIETSSRIFVHLAGTLTMLATQPGNQKQSSRSILALPKLVIDHRLEDKNAAAFDALFEPDAPDSDHITSGAIAKVWNPTIDVLMELPDILSAHPGMQIQVSATHVFRGLLKRSGGHARAVMATHLIQSLKARLGTEGLTKNMYHVVECVTGVSNSDQPWLAIPFIRDIVLNGEGADSAWHRHVLSFPFIFALPRKAASELLYTMADAMREKMREQNARPWVPPVVGEDGKAVQTKPAIKVTTIKMMAQLLEDSRVIGPSEACDMLLGLLAEARHIDVLVAIVHSLLSILRVSTHAPALHARILDALEEKLAPILPRLNQRRPLAEADWVAAESGEAPLPDVASEMPLFSLLINDALPWSGMSEDVRIRLTELLVRVPAQSALHNARWNKLFLARNNLALDEGETIPAAPACFDATISLYRRFPHYIPASTLPALRDAALVSLRPTPGIARATAAVKADRDLVNSVAGRHWLKQFDDDGTLYRFISAASFALMNATGPGGALESRRAGAEALTVPMLADAVLTVMDRVLELEDPVPGVQTLVRNLCNGRLDSRKMWLSWHANCLPLLRALTRKVDALREASVARRAALPSPFWLRMKALPIPYANPPKERAAEEDVAAFVAELDALLRWLAARRAPYHHELRTLKNEVRQGIRDRDYLRVAVRVGALDVGDAEGLDLAGYLRLDFAAHLFEEAGASGMEQDAQPEVVRIVRGWVGSDDELVRTAGETVQTKYKTIFSQ